MAKKKNQTKQKFSSKPENKEEKPTDECESIDDYVTVAEYENQEKYNKRKIESNWNKYEINSDLEVEDEIDGESSSTDFTFLANNSSSVCSQFQFSSEKLWEKSESLLPSSKIFNLDLDVLAAGLSCLPFYERIDMDKSQLSTEDIELFDEEARKNQEKYNFVDGKIVKKGISNMLNEGNKETFERFQLFGVDLEDYFKFDESSQDNCVFEQHKKEKSNQTSLTNDNNNYKSNNNFKEIQNFGSEKALTEEEQQLEAWLLEKLS